MSNEWLLILSVIVLFGSVVAFSHIFDEIGLYAWTVLATVAANIEVLILVDAFGLEQTLGNVLFASTFVVTDILSELYGRKAANKAVKLGIATSIMFIIISQSWLLYTPSVNDWASPSIATIFSNTPRVMLVGLAVYAVVQALDVVLYHRIWAWTTNRFNNAHGFLWLRNNLATLISQFINAVLFNFGAFWGVYDWPTLWQITLSTYVIYIFTTFLDTPAVYAARYLRERKLRKEKCA